MIKIKIPFSEFSFSFSKSSGAGGQNVNKVNTKVILTWNMKESPSCSEEIKARFKEKFPNYIIDNDQVQIASQQFRSQKSNLDDCIERLNKMLEIAALKPKIRKPTKPKKSSILKRLNSKRKESEKKQLRKKDY
ncbi:MAG: alternative ribosome rescue aminoacyl-tRNA hydrolase ArfB [Bacteriovoracaceae bacterium]